MIEQDPGVLYARAEELGVRVAMHTALMPGIHLDSAAVGEAFALGYCRALIQAAAGGEKQD